MTRNEFVQRVAQAGWFAYNLNPSWIEICRQRDYSSVRDGDINPMGTIDIVVTPEAQINLILPTRFATMCPGRPGQLRNFRVVAANWTDVWVTVNELYEDFGSTKLPFEDIVILTIPAERLIPDDGSFMQHHCGPNPPEWKPVQPTSDH